jgi:ubiquinone/menaquinone biosynthesis C-methylase UbiE
LQLQSEFLGGPTNQLLRMAGIGPGMRILDVGCGLRDITMMAARLAGASGSVIGVDTGADMLAAAERRAADAGLGNVSFRQASLHDVQLDGLVDAVTGATVFGVP